MAIEAAGNGNPLSYRDEVSHGIGHPGLGIKIPPRIEEESQNQGMVKKRELTHSRPELLLHSSCLCWSLSSIIILILSSQFLFSVCARQDSKHISSGNYGKGYRYNIQGWTYLHLEGTPYERGYQYYNYYAKPRSFNRHNP